MAAPTAVLYLEDLIPGTTGQAGPVTVSEAEAIAFAQKYDPQPFHTDPEAARQSPFGGVILSGWQTVLVTMRMLVDSPMSRIANGLVGIEIRKMRLPRPVRPG